MHLMKRIKNFLNIRELIPVLKILIHEKPDIFMAYNKLIKLIDELGLSEKVTFSGIFTREQLIKKYRSSSIFCLASLHENFARYAPSWPVIPVINAVFILWHMLFVY